MRDGYLGGALSRLATRRQMDVLAAFVAAGGSVPAAAELVGIQPSTVKRHLADLRARSGLTTEQLIYRGRAEGWLLVPSLERCQQIRMGPQARGRCEGLTSTRPA
jgi:DNA-binding MarR family transcriptional regulator